MKQFNLKNYKSVDAIFEHDFIEEASKLEGTKVIVNNKPGVIYEIEDKLGELSKDVYDVLAIIDFDDQSESGTYPLFQMFGHDRLIINEEDKKQLFINIKEALTNFLAEVRNSKIEMQRHLDLQMKAYKENQEKLVKEYQAEERAKKAAQNKYLKQQRTLAKLKTLKKVNYDSVEDWLRANCSRVSVILPDFCESWFKKEFPNEEYTVISSNKKTSSGNPMKWGLSMSTSVKKDVEIPTDLKDLVKNNKIQDTAFIWTLLKDNVLSTKK